MFSLIFSFHLVSTSRPCSTAHMQDGSSYLCEYKSVYFLNCRARGLSLRRFWSLFIRQSVLTITHSSIPINWPPNIYSSCFWEFCKLVPSFRKFSYGASCPVLVPPLHPGWSFHHSAVWSPGNSCSFTGPHFLPEATFLPLSPPRTKPFITVTIMTSGCRTYSHHSRYCLFLLLIMCILKSFNQCLFKITTCIYLFEE